MRIEVDPEVCTGHGRCYTLAPRSTSPTTTATARPWPSTSRPGSRRRRGGGRRTAPSAPSPSSRGDSAATGGRGPSVRTPVSLSPARSRETGGNRVTIQGGHRRALCLSLALAACGNSGDDEAGPDTTDGGGEQATGGEAQRDTFVSLSGVPGVTDDEIAFAVVGTENGNPLGTCILDCYHPRTRCRAPSAPSPRSDGSTCSSGRSSTARGSSSSRTAR